MPAENRSLTARGDDSPPPWLEAAADLACRVHAGQVDKSGQPYSLHPARVLGYLRTSRTYLRLDPDSKWVAQAAAWLHDVLEDTPTDRAALLAAGIPERVADVVELLTRRSQLSHDYYAAIARDSIARAVKLADIEDNTDPRRLGRLDASTRERLSTKYCSALEALGINVPTTTTKRRVLDRTIEPPGDSIVVDATLGPNGLELAGDDSQVEWQVTVGTHDLGRLMELLDATATNLLDKLADRFESNWTRRNELLQALDAAHVRYSPSLWFTD